MRRPVAMLQGNNTDAGIDRKTGTETEVRAETEIHKRRETHEDRPGRCNGLLPQAT